MIKKIITLFLILIPINSFALIEVDITRGNLDPLPVAVSPLSIDEKSRKSFNKMLNKDNIGEEISNIVENNLLDYKTDKLIYYTEVIDKKIVYFDSNGQKISYLSYNDLAKRLISQWMNSNGHRNNILSSTYNFLGCYCSIDENRVPILIRCTQNFGYK